MNGYNGRAKEGFGPMPAVGANSNLTIVKKLQRF